MQRTQERADNIMRRRLRMKLRNFKWDGVDLDVLVKVMAVLKENVTQ